MRDFLDKIIAWIIQRAPDTTVRRVMEAYHRRPALQDRIRYHVKPFRVTSPIPNRFEMADCPVPSPKEHSFLPADVAHYARIIEELAVYGDEPGTHAPFDNPWYGGADGAILHAMIRRFKPARLVEIGSGFSTQIASAAVQINAAEGYPCEITCIDPEPRRSLEGIDVAWIERPVQAIPMGLFPRLARNDMLFVDSSHVLKMQSDVLFLLSRVLPRAAPGVIVHFHDIFTPFEYPSEFSLETCHMNEQYAIECVLANTDRWEILLPVHWLFRTRPDLLARVHSGAPGRPSAFWMRKKC